MRYGPSFPYEAVEKIWRESYVEHFLKRPVDVKPGARELLSYCRNKDIPCGLATSRTAPRGVHSAIGAGCLEDSPRGVHSAIGAGCQVPSLVEPSQELRALGHTIVDSLQDVLRALRGIEQPQQA